MPRAPGTFRQADIVRAVKAARAAGFAVGRIEIDPEGRIVLIADNDNAPIPVSAFDKWKASQNARSVEGPE